MIDTLKGRDSMIKLIQELYEDAKNIKKKDPAARSILEVVILYQGFHILVFYRIAHIFYRYKLFFVARLISQIARFLTGIENDNDQICDK